MRGILFVYGNVIASWNGITSFISNYAHNEGGSVYVYGNSIVTWDGNTSFMDNTAGVVSGGGEFVVKDPSTGS